MKNLIITAALAIVLAGCTKPDTKQQQQADPCAALVANCSGTQNYLKMGSDGYDTLAVELFKRGDFGTFTQVGQKRILIVGSCMAFDVKLYDSYFLRIQGVKGSGQHPMLVLSIDNAKSCTIHEYSYY